MFRASVFLIAVSCIVLPKLGRAQVAQPDDVPAAPSVQGATETGTVPAPEAAGAASAGEGAPATPPAAPTDSAPPVAAPLFRDAPLPLSASGPSAAAASSPTSEPTSRPAPAQGEAAAHPLDGLRVGGRVYAQWVWQSDKPRWDTHLDSARLGARWSDGPLDSKVEMELFSTDSDGNVVPALRDAWVAYEVTRPLQFKVGQMKKPFSRLTLMSRSELPAISRGLVIQQLVGDRDFGGRDMGAEVFGRVGSKRLRLNYAAGLFQGGGINQPEGEGSGPQEGAWAGRVELENKKRWSVGVDFSQRTVEPGKPRQRRPWAAGLDGEVRWAHWHALAETVFARDPNQLKAVNGAGVTGMLTYELALSGLWALEPIVGGEWVKPNLDVARSQSRVFGGASLIREGGLRLMLEGEQTMTHATGAPEDERALTLQIAWDR